jgi:hypothetical protein
MQEQADELTRSIRLKEKMVSFSYAAALLSHF